MGVEGRGLKGSLVWISGKNFPLQGRPGFGTARAVVEFLPRDAGSASRSLQARPPSPNSSRAPGFGVFFFSAPFPYGVQPTLGQIPAWQTAGNRGKTAAAAPGASKGPQQDGRGMRRRERLPGNRSVGDTMSGVPPSFPPAALQFLPHPPLDEAEESPPHPAPKPGLLWGGDTRP